MSLLMFMTLDTQIHHGAQSELILGKHFNQRLQVNLDLLNYCLSDFKLK